MPAVSSTNVSISLSSGFSFQVAAIPERKPRRIPVSISLSSGFSFQARRLTLRIASLRPVSISLSSGFSFQVQPHKCPVRGLVCFNLVIERLLISGQVVAGFPSVFPVSISLSSGFSFQAIADALGWVELYVGFNLVIERLLISGQEILIGAESHALPFQSRYRAASHFRVKDSSALPISFVAFQSRYRAASHFRLEIIVRNGGRIEVSISLSSGFSFQGRGCHR